MTVSIDLSPELGAQLREEAIRRGQDPAEYVKTLVEAQMRLHRLETLKNRDRPQSLGDLRPRIPPPAGCNVMDQIIGQWPGHETDEEIQSALDAIS